MEAAFEAIAVVQAKMSFFEPSSDVSRINRAQAGDFVEVSLLTYKVLETANRFHRDSDGLFDITIAPELQRWGCLPTSLSTPHKRRSRSCQSDLELVAGSLVHVKRPVRIDLGGIAKGFAVDQAINAMTRCGAISGTVNAGGDLRTFGSHPLPIQVRHPRIPGNLLPLTDLQDEALATSAIYFSRARWRGQWISALLNGRSRSPCTGSQSVSVLAPDCMTADALTKIVMANADGCVDLLAACKARAFIVTRHGEIFYTTPPDAP